MDHSNLVDPKYSHGQCCHGMCLNHDPKWEDVGEKRREPSPGMLGKKTYWTNRHCGQPMARYKEVQTRRCRECGRTEDQVVTHDLALCLCCGYHVDHVLGVIM